MTTSKINTIKANPSNPRLIKNDKYKAQLKSIKDTPQMMNLRPVIIDDNRIILGGHMRWRACKELGWKEIPTESYTKEEHLKTDSWIKEKKTYEDLCREITIKDNTHYGEYDFDILANEWDDLPLNDWGLDVWEPKEDEAEGLTGEDDVPEALQEPITKLGDVWILGEHRVMCGDSTSKEAVEILMDGDKADMVFTDPPYGIGYEYNSHKDIQGNKYLEFCDKWFNILKDKTNYIVISTGWKYQKYWWNKDPKDCFYWLCKNKRTGGSISHFRKIEPLFIWGKPQKYKYDFDYFEQTTEIIKGLREQHTCPKPVSLILNIIKAIKSDEIILDVFLGSGTTLIAAEKTNRKCYGMELDPKYCDVIVKRWEEFTGKKATREIDDLEVMTQAH